MKNALTAAILAVMATASAGSYAHQEGAWIVRVGATTVAPNDDSDKITLPTQPDETVLRGVEVDHDTQLGLIPVYMITDNWGMELLAATPFEHDISVKGLPLDAGSTKHLPPTLSLQWYPRGGSSGWQPYVGVGLNYTLFFDEEVDRDLEGALERGEDPRASLVHGFDRLEAVPVADQGDHLSWDSVHADKLSARKSTLL